LDWNDLENAGILPPGLPEIAALREEFAPVVELERTIAAAIEQSDGGNMEEAIRILDPLQTLDEKNPLLRVVLYQIELALVLAGCVCLGNRYCVLLRRRWRRLSGAPGSKY
jgi:hypothetical protein